MKSKYYYGIGNDEYNYWKTTDNGMTWDYWKQGGGKVIIEDNKIIEGTEDKEIKESVDNGDTWEKKKDGEIIDGKPLYINDIDGKVTDKDGKEIGPGPAKKVYEEKDKIIIQGDDTRITIDKDGNKTFDIINFHIDDLLLYILNDIIIPKLTFALLGEKSLSDIKYDPYDGNNTYYSNSQMYLVNPDMIDFLMDVGMRPLSVEDLPEYKESKALEEELENQLVDNDIEEENISNKLLTNKSLANTFRIIDLLIDIIKKYYLRKELTKITNLKEDYDGLNQEEIPIMKMYYDLAKGSKESIIGTIINSIFTFNNSKKMALLKTSIINTAYNVKERIKLNIELLKNKIKFTSKEELLNNEYFKKILNFNLKKEWSIALKESLIDYYKSAKKNIISMTNNNDKDLISMAADKYKEYRIDFLKLASEELENLNLSETKYNIINDLDISMNELLNTFISKLNIIITGEDVKTKLYDLLNDYIEKEKEILKNSNNIFNNMLHLSAGKFRDAINIINVKNYGFDEDDYNETLSDLNYSSRKRVYDYYNEIIDKFKERCFQLYLLVGDKIIGSYIEGSIKTSDDLSIWVNNLLLSNDYNEYIKNNPLNYLYNNGSKACEDFYKLIRQEWNNSKEVI